MVTLYALPPSVKTCPIGYGVLANRPADAADFRRFPIAKREERGRDFWGGRSTPETFWGKCTLRSTRKGARRLNDVRVIGARILAPKYGKTVAVPPTETEMGRRNKTRAPRPGPLGT